MDELRESTCWYAEYVQVSPSGKYQFCLGSDGYTTVDGRLSQANADNVIRSRAQELNDGKYSGKEVIVGFVMARADTLASFLSRDENLGIQLLSGERTRLGIGDMAR